MKNYINLCQREAERCLSISITEDEMNTILQDSSNSLKSTLDEWGYEEDDCGLDTADRDVLFDAIAKFMGFTHWPMNFEYDTEYSIDFRDALMKKSENEWKLIYDEK